MILSISEIESMRPLSDGTVAVCGAENDQVKLAKYDMQGTVVVSTNLENTPFDMVEVLLIDKPCLAVVYG